MDKLTFIGKLPTILSDDILDNHWDKYDVLHPRAYPRFMHKMVSIKNIDGDPSTS